MFITPAFAQGASAAGGGTDMLIQLAPFLLIFVVMYFLILRPQQKKAKAHQEMVNSLRRGDVVITSGGLVGKVARVVDEAEVELQIADNVKVRQLRAHISMVRSKGEPAKDETPA
ncbi:preprotein translocase subunit YajC [Aquabacter cavernae]|uniref:preprotein translocase subunit YajC n=1 Tax=Aquabacter cavernae TaxID=2496029 RepID=UPI000F8C81B3|nr:preprotein translocase subunit YajC [Aquabacter cavernae]